MLLTTACGKDNDMKRFLSAQLRSGGSTINRRPLFLCVVLLGISSPVLLPQSDASGSVNNRAAFAGTWKGVCQDGKPFVFLTLRSTSSEIEGTISLGDVNLGNSAADKGGTCTATNPASRDHSMSIKNAAVDGQKLTFESSRGTQVEMILTSKDTAKLRFPGTPMEDASFEIHKATPAQRE
jgi:hypothetical protein